jgi:hypothetical protein
MLMADGHHPIERKAMKPVIKLTAGVLSGAAAALFVTAAPGHAATMRPAGAMSALGNSCNFPTSAHPNSRYVESYGNCYLCRFAVYSWGDIDPLHTYYCTYNPSNNKNDVHYDL